MRAEEMAEFEQMLREMAAMHHGVIFNEYFVAGYYRVLKELPLPAIRTAALKLLQNDQRKQVMPSAAEIRALASTFTEPVAPGYLQCREAGCHERIPWPPSGKVMERSYYCTDHQRGYGKAPSVAERAAMAALMPAKVRAFLRSASPQLMESVPLTEEEAAFLEDYPRNVPKALREYLPRVDAPTRDVVLANFHTRLEHADDHSLD